MEASISPEEFRKLQMKVDILQKFLTKTFGSSFLDFCKEAQLSMSKESKPLPPLNKALLNGSVSNGTVNKVISKSVSNGNASSNGNHKVSPATRRPPPLLHRPSALVKTEVKPSTSVYFTKNAATVVIKTDEDEVEEQEYYDDEGSDDVVQFLQPETVFSDDEHQGGSSSPTKTKQNNVQRNGIKRDHSSAFGYDADEQDQADMILPEGTECIVVEAEDDQGQSENYEYKQDQDEDLYEEAGNGEELYEEDGYSYSMMEDGIEVTSGEQYGENYQAEELKTDGNVTFGTVYTDPTSGMQYFQCAFCPSAKVFKHKQSLKEHYLLNHSPTPPAYQCQCGRRFLKQSQLKRHEVVHTAERPFVCPVCGKDFTRKDNMSVHMTRNHAEKKHPCPYCPDKVYATPAEVNRHLRMYHSQWQP